MTTRTILAVLSLAVGALALSAFSPTSSAAPSSAVQGRGGSSRGAAKPAAEGPAPEDDASNSYFDAADWDGDGWIRFTEAEQSMGLDQSEFSVYDTDHDGLIDAREFSARYRAILVRGGAFTPPRAKPDLARPKKRDGKALLLNYDADLDGMLVESELRRAMEDAHVEEPTALVMLTTLDKDRSGGIDGAELEELSKFLFPEQAAKNARKASSVAELFDHSTPVDERAGSTLGPRRTVGPIPVFRRLDYDRSGGIDLRDLEELQRPLRSAVRPAAVLATLDTDGNGSISPEEFAAAMR